MRLPTWEEMDVCTWDAGAYQLDFMHLTAPLPYRRTDFWTVYKDGPWLFTGRMAGDPGNRVRAARQFGLEFASPSEVTRLEFYTPDGEKVGKKDIDSPMLYIDRRWGRAYGYEITVGYRRYIRWYHKDAQPHSSAPVRADVTDKDAVKAAKHKLKDKLAMAFTASRIYTDKVASSVSVVPLVQKWLDGEEPEFTAAELAAVGACSDAILKALFTKRKEFDYLLIKEK